MRFTTSTPLRVWAVLALYFVLHLPVLAGVTRVHPDEHYYTDAALRMVQTGDYVTPVYADGSARFNKPILTYWSVAAGFLALGVNVFASRILFLVAGCLILWLAHRLARALFRDEDTAFVALIVLFANDELYGASMRANPDVLLTLGVALAGFGFARVLLGGSRAARDLCAGYAGIGLAVAAKGLLGIVLLLYVWIAARLVGRKAGFGSGRLVHGPAMMLGLLIAGFWYAMVVREHGAGAIEGFLGDQVGMRLSGESRGLSIRAATYFLTPLVVFLPWSAAALALVPAAPGVWRRFHRAFRAESLFVLGWCALLLVIFSIGNMTRPRYLLPAYPFLAAWIAALLVAALREARARRVGRVLLRVASTAGAVLGVFCLVAGLRLDSRVTVFAAVWTSALIALHVGCRRRGDGARFVAVGLLVLLLPWGYDLWLRPILGNNPAPALAARLEAPDAAGRPVHTVGVSDRHLGNIRVLSGGRVWPRASGTVPRSLDPDAVYIVGPSMGPALPAGSHRLEPCGHAYGRVSVGELWTAMVRGDMAALEGRKRRLFQVAVPDEGSPSP